MGQIKGVIPPAITIFDEQGLVDYEAMKRHADYMIQGGVDGIAYLGTSGEFGVMTQKQKLELIYEMTEYVGKRVKIVIGIGDTCLENSLELGRAAEKAGADAVLSLVPYFSVYGEENVEAYYGKLADELELPIILYNFPALTGFDVHAGIVKKIIAEHENVIGVKDTIEDAEHLKAMLELKKEKIDFSVFCAYETQAYEISSFGIDGFINATANFAPQYTVGFLKAKNEGREEEMEIFYRKMCQASKVYAFGTPLLLAVKEAVYQKVLGKSGYEKLPGLPLGREAKNGVEKIISELI